MKEQEDFASLDSDWDVDPPPLERSHGEAPGSFSTEFQVPPSIRPASNPPPEAELDLDWDAPASDPPPSLVPHFKPQLEPNLLLEAEALDAGWEPTADAEPGSEPSPKLRRPSRPRKAKTTNPRAQNPAPPLVKPTPSQGLSNKKVRRLLARKTRAHAAEKRTERERERKQKRSAEQQAQAEARKRRASSSSPKPRKATSSAEPSKANRAVRPPKQTAKGKSATLSTREQARPRKAVRARANATKRSTHLDAPKAAAQTTASKPANKRTGVSLPWVIAVLALLSTALLIWFAAR